MIISASRRTDIPAFYSEWFCRRMSEGYALVRNPLRPTQVRRVKLTPDVVDGIVFWTRNPAPLIDSWKDLTSRPSYFLFTITPYGKDLEPHTFNKKTALNTFARLSKLLGPERVIWRYDPIIISQHYDISFHIENFSLLTRALEGLTNTCITSFFTPYAKTKKRMQPPLTPTGEFKINLLAELSSIAADSGIELQTCCSPVQGVPPSRCIDPDLMGRIAGFPLSIAPDKGQRKNCNCAKSIDIGAYNTCTNACTYCYATSSPQTASTNRKNHDPNSPLLTGNLTPACTITKAKQTSSRSNQTVLF